MLILLTVLIIDYSYYLSKNQIKTNTSMFFSPVTDQDILKIINKLDMNKSSGHNGLCSFIVKKIAHVIVNPLHNLFNASITTGIVPGNLNIAKVILPLHV